MAFWDRWRNDDRDRGRLFDRFRDHDRGRDDYGRGGDWGGRDRDYDRPYDRGYGTDYGRDRAFRGTDREYGRDDDYDRNYGRGDHRGPSYGAWGSPYGQDRDRWSSGRMRQGSYDDFRRDRDDYRGSAGGSDFDRGGYAAGSSFGYGGGGNNYNDYDRPRHSSGRHGGGSYGRGNYDRTDLDDDRDRWGGDDRDRGRNNRW